MQGVLRGKSQLAPEIVRDQAIQSGAFVNFIEMRKGLAREEHTPRFGAFHRRAFDVIEGAFDQIAGGHQIFQALLILDADG